MRQSYTSFSCITRNSCGDARLPSEYSSPMDDIHKRIKAKRLEKGLSMQQLATAVGLKGWQSVQQWEKPDDEGGTAPRRDKLQKVADALGVTAEWLQFGAPAPENRDQARQVVHLRDEVEIPRFDARASMGPGAIIPENDTIVEFVRVTKSWIREALPTFTSMSNLALMPAHGDSMEESFSDGDLLWIDTGVCEVKIDAVYVLALNDQLYVKRLQRRPDGSILMISDNKKYEPYLIENGERQRFRVLGRVIFAWTGKKI